MIIRRNHWPILRDQLCTLFEASFNRKISVEYFDWRYFKNTSQKFHFAVFGNEGELSASYSACPIRMIYGKELFETAMSMTTMTHPNARGQGIFPKLALELYADMKVDGVSMVWGFPNANSHLTFIEKLGWRDIYEIPTLILEVANDAIAKFLPNETVVRDDDFLLEYTPVRHHDLICIEKSKQYLLWRYRRNPINTYQVFAIAESRSVKAFVISKCFGSSVDFVDIQSPNPTDALILLSSAINYWVKRGVRRYQCWAPAHHFLHGVLERLGFRNGEPVTYLGGCFLGETPLPVPWFDYKHWYIQMGDSDVY